MSASWTGVVLAGGKSTRMGKDKALLEVNGKPLLVHALERLRPLVQELLVIGDPHKYRALHPKCIADDLQDLGPLGGVVTAMNHAKNDRLLVLACDVPGVNATLLQQLQALLGDADAAVPRHDGRLEPLAAAYDRRCAEPFLARLMRNDLSMQGALDDVRTVHLDVTPGTDGWPQDLFRNLNSPDDL